MAVMYLGKIVELSDRDDLYLNPLHPYTQALMAAVPVPDPDVVKERQKIILEGDIPSPANPPHGCNFNTRCLIAEDICYQDDPEYLERKPGHWVSCHFADRFF
jgi:oligopeptide/dipeptide ABC transporter ATP-binding protein